MTTKKTGILATTAAGAVLIGSGIAAAALTGTTATATPQQHSVTYVAHDEDGNLAFDDLGEPSKQGPDLGDVLAFTQRLTRNGKTVGRVSNTAIGVDHTRHLFHATGTVVLKDGTVEYGGLVSLDSHFVLGVTGGTGHYAGAAGTLAFDNEQESQQLTLTLTP